MKILSTCTISILCVIVLAELMLAQQPANKPGEATLQSIPKPKIAGTMPAPTPDSVKAAQAKYFDWFAKYRTVGALSSARPGDHEDAGLLNEGDGAYTGVFAVHRIYAPSEFHLVPPAGASDVHPR